MEYCNKVVIPFDVRSTNVMKGYKGQGCDASNFSDPVIEAFTRSTRGYYEGTPTHMLSIYVWEESCRLRLSKLSVKAWMSTDNLVDDPQKRKKNLISK